MADRTDDLLISVSTDLTTIKRQLKQLGQDVGTATSGIQKQFEGAGRGIDKSMSSLQDTINRVTGIARQSGKEWAGALAAPAKQLDDLRRAYVPAYDAARTLQEQQQELTRALSIGAISLEEYSGHLDKLAIRYDATVAAAAKLKAEYSSLAEAERLAASSSDGQRDINALTGVGAGTAKSARDSAALFAAEMDRLDTIASQKARQIGDTFGSDLEQRLVPGVKSAARDSASVFEAELSKLDEIARLKSAQVGSNFAADLNASFGIGAKSGSAAASASVFEESARDMDEMARKATYLKALINPLAAAQDRYNAELAEYSALASRGALTTDELAQAQTMAKAKFDATTAAMRNQAKTLGHGAGNFNTANIAAQFQDIGVTAAMGMNPLQIALQQGTQLSAVLSTMGGTKNTIAGLGAAFASIVSPVSLVTIGVVGLTAAAIEYFTTFESGSSKSEETLKTEADLIQKVASQWGVALPALKAYADEQAGLADQQDKLNALVAARENSGAPLLEGFTDATAEVADLQDKLNTLGENSAAQQLRDKFEELKKEVGEGTVTQQSFNDVIELAKATFADAKINGDGFIAMLSNLAGRASALIPTMASLAGEVDKVFGGSGSPNGRSVRGKKNGYDPRFGELPDTAPTPDKAPNREDQGAYEDKIAARAAKAASKAPAKTADDRFFEDIEAIRQRTAALAQEQAIMGLSFEQQQKRKIAFDLETTALKQVREEARKKGEADWQNAQLTPDQIAKINAVSDAYAKQADELRKAQDMQDLQRDVLKGTFDDLRSALDDGKLDWQDFAKIAEGALDKIIDKIENDLIDSIMQANGAAGGGGGILGGILGLFGGGSSNVFPGGGVLNSTGGLYADGGFTGAGGKNQPAGIVHKGEYVFDQDAVKRIGVGNLAMLQRGYANGGLVGAPSLPRIQAPANQNGAPNITFAPTINMPNAQKGAGEEVTQALKKFEREFTPRVLKSLRDARTTGMI
ncbi:MULTISPECIES: phage tail length tape measure family protein [unclassified Mesorhizobium]|uniref:phage tail length tape measure family protein n=1 Tax=unclassified Mesorhizobium TaxID=325217 RepID=UPI0011292485|nr:MULTISPECIES: phage tail length tape measure family protein [unclassified Mesorhizobium]TPJ86962.1 hypothetical protein FJ489_30910 [Mesorhizobium sp. B2-5-12]TPK19185.1 hypothetical protein FJ562_31315 [Mesorhizobium sp. B2-5-6]